MKLSRYYSITKLRQIYYGLPKRFDVKRRTIRGFIKMPNFQKDLNLNNYLDFESEDETVRHFVEVLNKEFSHCNLSSFYERIKDLKISYVDLEKQEKLSEQIRKRPSGKYGVRENRITIKTTSKTSSKEIEDIKTHELLHMASSGYKEKLQLCGFGRADAVMNIELGRCLTEGYTEYLNMKYFQKMERGAYYGFTELAGKIEDLIGSKQMEKFYFSNDLNGVINGLAKYSSQDAVIELLWKMDDANDMRMQINDLKDTKKSDPEEKIKKEKRIATLEKWSETLFQQATVDFANIALEKYNEDFSTGKISEQKYIESIYKMELYINGVESVWCTSYDKSKQENPDNIAYCRSRFSMSATKVRPDIIISMPYSEFEKRSNEYYDSFQETLKFTYEPWKDANGKTTKDYIDEKIEQEKQERKLKQIKSKNANAQSETQQETEQTENPPISKQEKQQELASMFDDKKESNQPSENLTSEQQLQQMVAAAAIQAVASAINNAKQNSKVNQ